MVQISKHWLALLPAAILVAACGESPNHSAPKPAIGAFGLDLSAADPSVKAGDDFFAHAGGKWLSSFQIPEDKTSYGPFVRIADDIEVQLRSLIEAAAAAPGAQGSASQLVGDYYASFMDEAAIEKAGLEPIAADLSRIQAARDKKDIATLFGTPGMPSVFKIFATPDAKHPDKYSLEIGQSGLGLPNRDYYLKDDAKLKEVRAQYLAYIEQMLTLGGVNDAATKAKEILAFETSLAQVYWPIERLRDADATYNPYTKAQLLAYAPGFDWQAYLQAKEIPARESFVLGPTTAIRDAAQIVQRISLDTLKAYLTFHTLNNQAAYLPKRFDDAQFAFNGKVVRGQPVQRDRWKRAVAEANKGVGELVGRMYVEKHDQGRKFAADGSLEDWWTEADATAFTAQTTKLIEQYSSFEALPGLNVNGAITIGENIGDLGGLNMSLHAYKLSLSGKPAPIIDGLTGEQRFFLSWAQIWRAKYRDEALRVQVLSDPHSPSQFRVNGAVRNMDEWYQAFDIKPTNKLYLPPDQRVKIW